MGNVPKCSSPKGPMFCTDKTCPALGKDGRHIVVVPKQDLEKGIKERLEQKRSTSTPLQTAGKSYAPASNTKNDELALFDLTSEWMKASVNFYVKARGAEAAFYAEPGIEQIVAKIEYSKNRDIYIVLKGNLRVEYGKHVIRSGSKLIQIGITNDAKLQRALSKGLITITQSPKFEAVEIRYMGRKDESRTPIGPASPNLATVIFDTIKYVNEL
jgi:hypothetical protein